jgi:ferredoxin-NADP reductase
MKARLVDIRTVAERTAAFTFEVDGGPFTFKAGQSCDVILPRLTYEDDRGDTRAFSIASSPADLPRVVFATRLTGSGFKRSLVESPAGTEVEIDGPFGSFTLHQNTQRPAVFLAGGIGITPFRGIIKDAIERGLPHRLALFHSNRTAGGTAFLSDFETWAQASSSFLFVPTLTDPQPSEPWRHGTGPIGADLLKKYLPNAAEAIFYVAGPPVFVKAMRDQVLPAAGADPDNIRAEEFAGY